jgi:hypothetical protein
MKSSDPGSMLDQLRSGSSIRKLYLLGCAAHRQQWEWLDDDVRRVVQLCEHYADGAATVEEVSAATKGIVFWDTETWEPTWTGDIADATNAYVFATWGFAFGSAQDKTRTELIHCVLGNLLHNVTIEPESLGPTVVSLARGIYEDRTFERLPILADALQDAGLSNSEVLDHCHGPGPHALGCWVIDLILGKN